MNQSIDALTELVDSLDKAMEKGHNYISDFIDAIGVAQWGRERLKEECKRSGTYMHDIETFITNADQKVKEALMNVVKEARK